MRRYITSKILPEKKLSPIEMADYLAELAVNIQSFLSKTVCSKMTGKVGKL